MEFIRQGREVVTNVSSVRSMVDVMCMGVLVVTLCFSMYRPGIGDWRDGFQRIHLGEIRQTNVSFWTDSEMTGSCNVKML